MSARIGIVVPAWNEAFRLPRLLDSIARQDRIVATVVVVANGCSDRTADVARTCIPQLTEAGHRLAVLELGGASKPEALNAGDTHLKATGPRAYVDADVILSPNALSLVAEVLEGPGARLAAPRIGFDRSGTGRASRVAGVLERLPPFTDDVVGGGFYAVSQEGRRRWGLFPPLIADDAYVVSRFDRAERILVRDAVFTARFPDDDHLLATLTRWEAGRRQMAALGIVPDRASRWSALGAVLGMPGRWLDVALLLRLKHLARLRRREQASAETGLWARADGGQPAPRP